MYHESLKQRAQKLGLRGADLAALINVSAPKLSNFFRGRVPLDHAKRKELNDILVDVERLKIFFPIPVGTHDPKLLALAIERLRQKRFEPFRKLMQKVNWEHDEAELSKVRRHFPRLFKGEDDAKKKA